MSRRRSDEVCMFCGMSPCECAGPPKKRVAKKKPTPKPVAQQPKKAGPARVKVVELPPEPVKVGKPKARRVTPESIALHRALEAFAEHDMLPPETYRKYPDVHPPKDKNVRR